MPSVTPAAAFDRYERAREEGLLIQGAHHKTVDGRRFSGILGVLGDGIQSADDCPERIMPRWLAHEAVRLFAVQTIDDAKTWGTRLYGELKRLDGRVPFSVVHDWHANTVTPFAAKFSDWAGPNPWVNVAPVKELMAFHKRALDGERIAAFEWHTILKRAFSHAYNDRVLVNLNNIDLNNMGQPHNPNQIYDSARLAELNATSYSKAFASADASEYARASGEPTNPEGYGFDAYASAVVNAYGMLSTHAKFITYVGSSPPYDLYNAISSERRRKAFTELAEGLVVSLERAR